MSEDILEIPIVEDGTCIFNRGDRYIVPIYQRAFAWGTGDSVRHNEIIQLMDDVHDSEADIYRLGSLIVARRNTNAYEVIDGQQRLTALFLILSQLKLAPETGSLSYACRPSAESMLERISKGSFSLGDGVSENDPASGIVAGMRAIKQKIDSQDDPDVYKSELLDKLKNTRLCRIVVPENTDLNRYFEIMNTRGEQLEPQDIVKARLMETLDDDADKWVFSTIWDACSDMDGYCQMHFRDTNLRSAIFGGSWSELKNYSNGTELLKTVGEYRINSAKNEMPPSTFHQLVTATPAESTGGDNDEQYSRYESVIDFRHFLLLSLNVLSGNSKGTLDDSRLIETFENALNRDDWLRGDFARNYIWKLLKCRYLFDRYVIKRVYNSKGDSEWRLDELYPNSDGGASFRRTVFADEDGTYEGHENVLMLEACMRVTYLDPKNMHWLTQLLRHLSGCESVRADGIATKLKDFAKKAIEDFLANEHRRRLGVGTPHIVFNYLDYLLLKRQGEVEEHFKIKEFAKGFAFEYRSSVEHWYPQNPPDGITIKWGDNFGNLCILRGDINSHFSNLSPESKQRDREQYVRLEHQSLKLRLMATITEHHKWDKETCDDHEAMMLRVLRGEPLA